MFMREWVEEDRKKQHAKRQIKRLGVCLIGRGRLIGGTRLAQLIDWFVFEQGKRR